VDPLFGSAAHARGSGVVGVVLSGVLDDGTAGLLAIKRQGGVAIVQDPQEARYDSMPASAIQHVPVDHVGPVAGIAGLLIELTRSPEEVRTMPGDAEELDWEVAVSLSAEQAPLAARPGAGWVPSALSCPDCHGVLWERRDGDLDRYRCRVGHGWSAQSLAQHQAEGVDGALWAVLKDVEEQAEFTTRLSQAASDHGHRYNARYWAKQAKRAEQTAASIRQLLANRASSQESPQPDANVGAGENRTG
jgi:two-component system, chemotaxis family, protein-glutamate methylesterase/glutaminase